MKFFSHQENIDFGSLSGDTNPLHTDPLYARRLLFGGTVVHGMHLVIYALDKFCELNPYKINFKSFKVIFFSPLKTDDVLNLGIVKKSDTSFKIHLTSNDHVICRIDFDFIATNHSSVDKFISTLPPVDYPNEIADGNIENVAGDLSLYLEKDLFRIYFPNAINWLDNNFISLLLSTTRLIGNYCPGLHSIYSELKLDLDNFFYGEKLKYNVVDYDCRFQTVNILISSLNMSGKILAFIRPKPQVQKTFSFIKNIVSENKFFGQNTLVIGGSRGLGEITCKLLAAGGANIIFTYSSGFNEAKKLFDEISPYTSKIQFIRHDITDSMSLKDIVTEKFHRSNFSIFYYATPYIAKGNPANFDAALLNKYIIFYIKGLEKIIKSMPYDIPIKIFIPSTIFIDEPNKNFIEYTTAKVATEFYFNALSKNLKNISLYIPRLPIMGTDQNASLAEVNQGISPTMMLNYLDNFFDR